LFYFQQQVTTGAACSAVSQTFALGNQPCFANICTWQSSNGPSAQSICKAGRASQRITPDDLQKISNLVIAICDIFAAFQQCISMEI